MGTLFRSHETRWNELLNEVYKNSIVGISAIHNVSAQQDIEAEVKKQYDNKVSFSDFVELDPLQVAINCLNSALGCDNRNQSPGYDNTNQLENALYYYKHAICALLLSIAIRQKYRENYPSRNVDTAINNNTKTLYYGPPVAADDSFKAIIAAIQLRISVIEK
jgi:hypothetical protein